MLDFLFNFPSFLTAFPVGPRFKTIVYQGTEDIPDNSQFPAKVRVENMRHNSKTYPSHINLFLQTIEQFTHKLLVVFWCLRRQVLRVLGILSKYCGCQENQHFKEYLRIMKWVNLSNGVRWEARRECLLPRIRSTLL
jgi:hypothetical protein